MLNAEGLMFVILSYMYVYLTFLTKPFAVYFSDRRLVYTSISMYVCPSGLMDKALLQSLAS